MIISRTPFRISFFGGGTDFPEYYSVHGGATLSTTINKYCYLSIHKLSPFFKHRFRASYSKTEMVQDPAEFEHPLIRECLLYMKPTSGLEIAHVSDLPGRTGLGTSSSFTVGLLNALHAFAGDRVTPEDLAQEAILIERTRVGDVGGHQDQFAAAYGGLLRLDYGPGKSVIVKRLAIRAERIKELEQRLMIFFTGIEQSAEAVLGIQSQRVKQNAASLAKMHAMVDKAEKILAGDGDLHHFGDLLHESWEMKKKLSDGISNPDIDKYYSAVRKAGARGGKLMGAGGRGFLLVYAEPDNHAAVRASLPQLKEVPFAFGQEGSRIIYQSPE